MNLYELAPQIRAIETQLESGAENADDYLTTALTELKSTEVDVAENVVKWIQNIEALGEMFKAEADRLKEKHEACKNRVERLRNYLRDYMIATGTEKIDVKIRKVSLVSPKSKVVVDNAEVIHWPDDVQAKCVTFDVKVNLTDLKRIPGFEKLPGVTELEGKTSIMIR